MPARHPLAPRENTFGELARMRSGNAYAQATERHARLREQQTQAIGLLASGLYTHVEVAAQLQIAPLTLDRWCMRRPFQERVREAREQINKRMLRIPIAQKARRLEALNQRWEGLHAILEARARAYQQALREDPDPEHLTTFVPGAETGLLIDPVPPAATPAGNSPWPASRATRTPPVDFPLLKELREHEKQAAMELGQWQEGAATQHVTIALSVRTEAERLAVEFGMSVEDVLREADLLAQQALQAAQAAQDDPTAIDTTATTRADDADAVDDPDDADPDPDLDDPDTDLDDDTAADAGVDEQEAAFSEP